MQKTPAGAPPPKPSQHLLGRPPEEAARLLALHYLEQAVAARERLTPPDPECLEGPAGDLAAEDNEALHDFRVALRRLRSLLRAYRQWLGKSVSKKLARRLRRLAAATGTGRDAEVEIAWLRSREGELRANQRSGHRWLVARLESRKAAAYEAIVAEVAVELTPLAADLRAALSVYRTEVHLDPQGALSFTFGQAAAAILAVQVAELVDHLNRIRGAEDEAQSHQARIAAKRLRYLLEPLKEELPAVAAAVARLKGLQELLGDLHDAHVLEREIVDSVASAAAERASEIFALALSGEADEARLRAERRRRHEPGLLAAARRNRARRDSLHADLDRDWLGGRAAEFFDQLAALVPVLVAGRGEG